MREPLLFTVSVAAELLTALDGARGGVAAFRCARRSRFVAELRTVLAARSKTMVMMTPTTATLIQWPRVPSTSSPPTVTVLLKDVWEGIPAAARHWRTHHPKVWAGDWRPTHEAARLVKEAVA
jgi:hypothetical protein